MVRCGAVCIGAVGCCWLPAGRAQEQSSGLRSSGAVVSGASAGEGDRLSSLFPSDNERRAIAVSSRSVGASRRASCARDARCGRRFRARGRDAPYDDGRSLSPPHIPGVLGLVRVAVDYPEGWHDREETEETRGGRGAADNARSGEYNGVLLCVCVFIPRLTAEVNSSFIVSSSLSRMSRSHKEHRLSDDSSFPEEPS